MGARPRAPRGRPGVASRWRCAAQSLGTAEALSDLQITLTPLHGTQQPVAQSARGRSQIKQTRPRLPAMRMTARSAGSRTLPLPPEPPPLLRLLWVFPRFQGSVSPGLGEPLPPSEPSSATVRTSWSSPDMACRRSRTGSRLWGVLCADPPPSSPGHWLHRIHPISWTLTPAPLCPQISPPSQPRRGRPSPPIHSWPHPSSLSLRHHTGTPPRH